MTSSPAPPLASGSVRLQTFRGLRYAGTDRRTLAEVTLSPPPLWNFAALAGLARTHQHHVLRLLAPSLTGQRSAAETAARWLSSGALVIDRRPGLYVWRWSQHGHGVVGVAGALALPAGVAAHEEVSAGPLADRAAELGAGLVQPEPILLLYDGERPLAPTVSSSAPLVELRLDDAQHRVDAVSNPDDVADVNAALADQRLVVADGHHRWRVLSGLPGPHTRAFVLVVDVRRSDLAVGPIPRVVPGLEWDTVTATPAAGFVELADEERLTYLAGASPAMLRWIVGDRSRLVGMELSDDGTTTPVDGQVEACGPFARDVCHLHNRLLPSWGVDGDRLSYSHSWQRALEEANATSGLALEARAPALAEVMSAARGGILLPHKATSITPKPRAGLLMLDDAD